MQNNKYRVSGAFFENDRPNGPAFSGFVEIDGVKTHIALWPKTSAKGDNYFQVTEDRRKNQAQQGGVPGGIPAPRSPFGNRPSAKPPMRPATNNDMDDDIPFHPEL